MSMYTLINCPKIGCEKAGDIISVKIRENSNGVYTEIYNVSGRTSDNRWIKE